MSDIGTDLETIANIGGYESSDAVLEDAIRELLRRRPDLRTSLAIEKYRTEEVSVNRAAELAGMTTEEFKSELSDRGITRSAGFRTDEDRDQTLDDLVES